MEPLAAHSIFLFNCVITSLLCWRSHRAKKKMQYLIIIVQKKEDNKTFRAFGLHRSTVEVTHYSVPVGYTVVIDRLTRAE